MGFPLNLNQSIEPRILMGFCGFQDLITRRVESLEMINIGGNCWKWDHQLAQNGEYRTYYDDDIIKPWNKGLNYVDGLGDSRFSGSRSYVFFPEPFSGHGLPTSSNIFKQVIIINHPYLDVLFPSTDASHR